MFQYNEQNTITFKSKLEERLVFFFVCVGIVTITYGFFALVDFLPEKPGTKTSDVFGSAQIVTEGEETTSVVTQEVPEVVTEALPMSVIFDTLGGKEVHVLNPDSDDVATLDNALLAGVVRYPHSADFVNTGTILLLGHSSYLPKVNNKNFQAFNGIQKLVWGDTIRLRSADTEYVYSVDRVYEAKAIDATVDMAYGVSKLVLATCNSFGVKDDRFVVEATLVDSRPLSR